MATEYHPDGSPTAAHAVPNPPEAVQHLDIGELLARCRQDDQHAWGELIRRFSPPVRTVARSFRLQPVDCEDVCQLTWIQMIEGIRSIQHAGKLRAWVVTVARREAMRHRARSDRQVPMGGGHEFRDIVDTSVTPEERAMAQAEAASVRAAVQLLGPDQRALLLLLFSEAPASYTEISARLGIPRGSIGPTRRRALEQMKALLASEDWVNGR
ncbi:RNA polymerase sigma factor (sigma-70 family) [Streptomyces griseochromogenes]|uniref:RNA polymerase sigma factor (Sigma-70 family) n=1 Tax=Streptomyces griseochromogenes TaxID=68214 RepID=A0ABS4M659_9ACTN|nr:sigma-70 family RNA polymerase sigma factor [Streptomyces griseochromogenes]MBP2055138.1 RNA polymerase sigma factor (sigma-70 family) [Streptomyces griseochromogenes]